MKLAALQQNYNLLQSHNGDLTEEAERVRATHLDEVAGLEAKCKNSADIQAQKMQQKDRELEEVKVRSGFI